MDEFHELSIGDNSSTASNIGHENDGDAASGDVDVCKEKSGSYDCKTEESGQDKSQEAETKVVDIVTKSNTEDISEKSECTKINLTAATVAGDAKPDAVMKDSASSETCISKPDCFGNVTKKPNKDMDITLTENPKELPTQGLEMSEISDTCFAKMETGETDKTLGTSCLIESDQKQQVDDDDFAADKEIVTTENKQSIEYSTSDTNEQNNDCTTAVTPNSDVLEALKLKQSEDNGIKDETNVDDTNELKIVHNKPSESNAILSPLVLETPTSSNGESVFPCKKLTFSPSRHKMLDTETPCMLCDHIESNMDSKGHYNEYLCHIIVEHKLVIADVKLIADLQSYAVYWKKRFAEEPLDIFCSKIRTNTGSKDLGESEEYFLLCDALPEDKQIREKLQIDKLKKLLLRQEFERKDESFSRACPFCRRLFQGNRIILFNHMTNDHNFNIGHPDNIVNVRELLDAIQEKLDKVQCLFCEHSFPDRAVLREHMRKKGHRRLNPENKEFDKYYMINYLELGKNWLKLQSEPEKLDANSDDWSGWFEESQKAYCFFCKSSFSEALKVYAHMKTDHDFDFVEVREEMHLSFYQQIKLINYIRRQVYLAQVDGCSNITTKIKEDLKSNTKWNQPQYYFSTYEDDTLLCQLEDKEDVFEPEDNFVIGEDGIDCRSVISDSVLTDLVVRGVFDS